MTHSLNDVEAIHATPESICNPTNYDIGCDDVVNNQKNEVYIFNFQFNISFFFKIIQIFHYYNFLVYII